MNKFNPQRFRLNYDAAHECCPICGSKQAIQTMMQYLLTEENHLEFKDMNRCTCIACGDVRSRHGRISEIIASQIKNNMCGFFIQCLPLADEYEVMNTPFVWSSTFKRIYKRIDFQQNITIGVAVFDDGKSFTTLNGEKTYEVLELPDDFDYNVYSLNPTIGS